MLKVTEIHIITEVRTKTEITKKMYLIVILQNSVLVGELSGSCISIIQHWKLFMTSRNTRKIIKQVNAMHSFFQSRTGLGPSSMRYTGSSLSTGTTGSASGSSRGPTGLFSMFYHQPKQSNLFTGSDRVLGFLHSYKK